MKIILSLIVLIAGLAAGCASHSPSKGYIEDLTVTGLKLGVQQDPITYQAQLGVMRFWATWTSVPVFTWTNPVTGQIGGWLPDVIKRYETTARSGIFGGAGITATLATGSNAMGSATAVTVPPINHDAATQMPIAAPVLPTK
jgi:hypothetical protein